MGRVYIKDMSKNVSVPAYNHGNDINHTKHYFVPAL